MEIIDITSIPIENNKRKKWGTGSSSFIIALFMISLAAADPVTVASQPLSCPSVTLKSSFLKAPDVTCPITGIQSLSLSGVIEGDEISLQKALNIVYKNKLDHVAVLFYASWCPFSGTFRPSFSVLSSLFPSVTHFAIEESTIRPSILSKYGVHGFPTLFVLNSTMRVRYHGSRTLDSLIAFYGDVTGIKTTSVDGASLEMIRNSAGHDKQGSDQESCPFSWARSPENLLRQETYLALATTFVLLRLLYFIFPVMRQCTQFARRRYIVNFRVRSLWEHPRVYLNRAIQLLNSLKEPCKRSNLQGGAMNAKAWASKSLASVSFGDASTSR